MQRVDPYELAIQAGLAQARAQGQIEALRLGRTTPANKPNAQNAATQSRSEPGGQRPFDFFCKGCGEDCYHCPYEPRDESEEDLWK